MITLDSVNTVKWVIDNYPISLSATDRAKILSCLLVDSHRVKIVSFVPFGQKKILYLLNDQGNDSYGPNSIDSVFGNIHELDEYIRKFNEKDVKSIRIRRTKKVVQSVVDYAVERYSARSNVGKLIRSDTFLDWVYEKVYKSRRFIDLNKLRRILIGHKRYMLLDGYFDYYGENSTNGLNYNWLYIYLDSSPLCYIRSDRDISYLLYMRIYINMFAGKYETRFYYSSCYPETLAKLYPIPTYDDFVQ